MIRNILPFTVFCNDLASHTKAHLYFSAFRSFIHRVFVALYNYPLDTANFSCPPSRYRSPCLFRVLPLDELSWIEESNLDCVSLFHNV